MYKIYTSEAFILNTRIQGEANLTVNALTKDFGLIRAVAQGAMFLKSKNRFALQKLALSELSFVRGKEIWRVTTTRPISGVEALTRESKSSIARVFAVVERLVHGEEKDERLFLLLSDYHEFIFRNDFSNIGPNEMSSLRATAKQSSDFRDFSGSPRPEYGPREDEIRRSHDRKPELLILFRVLHHLGYIGDIAGFRELLRPDKIDGMLIDSLSGKERDIQKIIESSLTATQL